MKLIIHRTENGMKEIGYTLDMGFGHEYSSSVFIPEELNDIKEIERLALENAMDKDIITIILEQEEE